MTTDLVAFEAYEAAEARPQLDAFLTAYEETYAAPPYNEGPRAVADFIELYQVHVDRPGMRLVLGRDAADEVVGFGYGYLLAPNTSWWRTVSPPLPSEVTAETGSRTWVTIELAVRARWRRRGIAAGLHHRLLPGPPVERATLTVRPEPEAAPARAAYAAWGYQHVGVSRPWDGAPLYNVMIRDL